MVELLTTTATLVQMRACQRVYYGSLGGPTDGTRSLSVGGHLHSNARLRKDGKWKRLSTGSLKNTRLSLWRTKFASCLNTCLAS